MGHFLRLATRTKRIAIDDPYGILRRSYRTRDGKQSAPKHKYNSAALWDFHCIIDGPGDNQDCNRSAAIMDFCLVADPSRNESPDDNQQIGGIGGLCSTVRFLSVLDEFMDVPSP